MNGPAPQIGDDEVVVADQPNPESDVVESDTDRPDEGDSLTAAVGDTDVSDAPEEEATADPADSFLADLQRVSADFANYRRQTDKRHTELVQQAGSRLALQLLPVLDAFDAALQHDAEGVEPIRAQLLSVLEREGLETIGSVAEPFDPSRHEAAMHESADEEQEVPIVSEVLRTGYAWHGRVLRAAMVKVKG